MLFNSIEFLIFLPIAFICYWRIRDWRLQNLLVVVISYFFYAWWDWRFLFLMAFVTLSSYVAGILMSTFHSRRKGILLMEILLCLGILGLFKYYNFFVENVVALLDAFGFQAHASTLSIILPVGISFYTFQALGYVLDVYNGKVSASRDVVAYAAFISFFPQLVAGPIERIDNVYPQFTRQRKFDFSYAKDGCKMILGGFFKKLVIADTAAGVVDTIFNGYGNYNAASLALGAVLFSFQIYGDFSGYSDIAIGTSKLFGISLKKNFNIPYLSRNVAEFWRRWHISLNRWFVDYVYIPLGGSRRNRLITIRNIFAIFLLSGLWHGANWTFIVWGAYHAALLVAYKRLKVSSVLLTFVLCTIGWVIFRADNITMAGEYITRMLDFSNYGFPDIPKINLLNACECLLGICLLMLLEWKNRDKDYAFYLDFKNRAMRWGAFAVIAIWAVIYYKVGQAFIYFQF